MANTVAAIGTAGSGAGVTWFLSQSRSAHLGGPVPPLLSYALYAVAGLGGGVARLGAIVELGIGSRDAGATVVHVGSIVVGAMIVGVIANLQAGYLARVRRHELELAVQVDQLLEQRQQTLDAQEVASSRERQLAGTVELLTATLAAMPDAVFIFSTEGRVVLQNAAAERLVSSSGAQGDNRARALGASLVVRLLWQAMLTTEGEPDPTLEVPIELPNRPGLSLVMQSRRIARDRSDGAFLTIVRDVTEELASREAEEQQSRIAAVARMAGGLAHDSRNLLTSASTSAALLRHEERAPDRDRLLRLIDRATQQGCRPIPPSIGYDERGASRPSAD